MNHFLLIFTLLLISTGTQIEGCCFWKSKNKIAPAKLSLKEEAKKLKYEKMEAIVAKLKLQEIGMIHLDSNSINFRGMSEENKTLYLGLVAKRYQQNQAEILEMLDKTIFQVRNATIPEAALVTAHEFHVKRKKTGKQKLPSNLPSDILRGQEKLFDDEEQGMVGPHNSPETSGVRLVLAPMPILEPLSQNSH